MPVRTDVNNTILKERFCLKQPAPPELPNPHDCRIKNILIESDCLVFEFEDDISSYDSIRCYKSTAKSLIIRYHLAYDINNIWIYKRRFSRGLSRRNHDYKAISLKTLSNMAAKSLEYLSHYVSYCSIIIKLCAVKNDIVLEADVDFVEYEWILQH